MLTQETQRGSACPLGWWEVCGAEGQDTSLTSAEASGRRLGHRDSHPCYNEPSLKARLLPGRTVCGAAGAEASETQPLCWGSLQ